MVSKHTEKNPLKKKTPKKRKAPPKKEDQKAAKWKPSVGEKRILDVLLNPEHRLKHVVTICSIANVDRNVYYKAFRKKPFVELYEKESKDLMRKAMAPVINATIKQATLGSAPHAKILFTFLGLQEETKKIIFPDKDGKPQDISKPLSDMDRAARVHYLITLAMKRKEEAEEKAS